MKRIKLFIHEPSINKIIGREVNLSLMKKYLKDKEIDPQKILQAKNFDQLRLIHQAVDAILENDES